MQRARKHTGISEQEYLEGERAAEVKHEYVAGQVFAKTGASKRHVLIVGNVFGLLRDGLRGGKCMPMVADMKVRLPKGPRYYYPDVLVTCDPRDSDLKGPEDFVEHPSVLIEVLSPTTERTDRLEKLNAYRLLPSLQEYVLVSQDARRIEVFRREGKGWLHTALGTGDTLDLTSVGLQVPVDEVYAGTAVA